LVKNGNFSGGNEKACHGTDYNGHTACPGWQWVLAPAPGSQLQPNDPDDIKWDVTFPSGPHKGQPFPYGNGGPPYPYEDGDGGHPLTGWVTFGSDGGNGHELPPPDEIFQNVPTTPGEEYKVSFWLEYSTDKYQSFEVTWGSQTLFSETGQDGHDVLKRYVFDVMASPTGSSTELAFFGSNYPATNLLANVIVVPVLTSDLTSDSTDPPGDPPGVPESSTWAMMLLGFAGLSYVGYRARRSPPRSDF
jgi:hypothetical protein